MLNMFDYKKVYEVDTNWSTYDQVIAECSLYNYGFILVDGYGCPVDDEYAYEDAEVEDVVLS